MIYSAPVVNGHEPIPVTNHERWRFYNSEMSSPTNYIDAAWLFLISASLQRRVWVESAPNVWPNQFIFFVAPPGKGKGITAVVKEFLSWYKVDRTINLGAELEEDGKKFRRQRLLFPVSSTSTTFEKFVETLSFNILPVKGTKPLYMHCSTAFVLEELTSIFKRDANDMMSFLLEGWDCRAEYERETIGRGSNYVKNMCLNIIGGTQPDKFSQMSNVEIISSGFTRRAILIYETVSRTKHFLNPPYTPAQLNARAHILQHLLKLSELYGSVALAPDVLPYMTEFLRDEARFRVNKSPYLDNYYTSKHIHVHKIALALHFGESTAMVIPLKTYIKATEVLACWELRMHQAFISRANSDVAEVKDDIIRTLSNVGSAGMTAKALYASFWRKVPWDDYMVSLTDLEMADKIKRTGDTIKLL